MLVTNDRDFRDNVPRLEGVNIKKKIGGHYTCSLHFNQLN